MGDRAVLTFDRDLKPTSVGVYLHWAGDPDSVAMILGLCKERHYRRPDHDASYAMARLIEAACEVAGPKDNVGIGVSTLDQLDTDNGDNGTYVIGGDWLVLARHHAPS